MKTLVINADDFGLSPARNAAIERTWREGVVTSVSLLANAPGWDDALRRLTASGPAGPGVGVHLNATEWAPLAGGDCGGSARDGRFLGKADARRRLLEGAIDLDAVESEFRRQIERIVGAGLRPDHLDGHNHIHACPGLPERAARLAAEYGIRWVRLPAEEIPAEDEDPALRDDLALYRRLTPAAAAAFRRGGILSTSRFFGLNWLHRVALEDVLRAVETMPDGAAEWMVHPGGPDEPPGAANASRTGEAGLLTSPSLRAGLKRLGVRLARFSDLERP